MDKNMKVKRVIFGILSFAAVAAIIAGFIRSRNPPSGIEGEVAYRTGRLEVQDIVDLGAVLNGTVVPAPFKFTNRGKDNALISHFKPDCSCIQLYLNQDGLKAKVEELSILPGESEIVYADLRISGDPGIKQASSIAFQDADRPEEAHRLTIFYTPVARFYTVPHVLVFGNTPADSSAARRIELRSDGSHRQNLDNITLRSSPIFTMKLVAAQAEDKAKVSTSLIGQHLIGFADLTFNTQGKEMVVREDLTLIDGDREICRISASGSAVADISISPTRLVLPRFESGKPTYTGGFICRSRVGKPFTIAPESVSAEFRVTVDGTEAGSTASYRVGITFIGVPPESSSKTCELKFKVKDEVGERSMVKQVIIGPKND